MADVELADDAIEVRETPGRGRGIFALRALPVGSLVMRALPGATALNTRFLQTHCCVCMQPLLHDIAPCKDCGAASLCGRCDAEDGPHLIHGDECALLKLLEATPPAERPADTTTLRLLGRLLMWRWRARTQLEAGQYMGEDGSWWGDGDVLGDDFDDVLELCQPPDGELPDKLATAFLDIAQQARFFLGAHARAGHDEVVALLGILHCNSLTVYDDNAHSHRSGGIGEVGAPMSPVPTPSHSHHTTLHHSTPPLHTAPSHSHTSHNPPLTTPHHPADWSCGFLVSCNVQRFMRTVGRLAHRL